MVKKKSKLRKWIEDIVFVAVCVLVIRTFIVQAYRIPSGSMEPTLLIGDHLFACKFFYGIRIPITGKHVIRLRKPRPGDIIIFRFPYERKDFVKRCIGVGGNIVEIRNKNVYVNGVLLNEPYAHFSDLRTYSKLESIGSNYQDAWERGELRTAGGLVRDNFGPVRVPPNSIFVMGDNRDYSFDSRFWGPLNDKYILGKAIVLYFSWNREPPLYKIWEKVRWTRIGKLIK
ncbi:MAG: signal peptidase I [bacterium]|nr:signal peptidase I [bacterium]